VFEETSGFIALVASIAIYPEHFIYDRSSHRILFGPGLLSSIGELSTAHLSYSALIQFLPYRRATPAVRTPEGLLQSPPALTSRISPRQRKMLNPAFSPSHMRALMPTFDALAEQASTPVMPASLNSCFPTTAPQDTRAQGRGGRGGDRHASLDVECRARVHRGWRTRLLVRRAERDRRERVRHGDEAALVRHVVLPLTHISLAYTLRCFCLRTSPTLYPLLPFRPLWTVAEQTLPLWLRRAIMQYIPLARAQKVRRIVETMHAKSVKIYSQKKAALLLIDDRGPKGSDQVPVGDGKDIMSTLRRSPLLRCRSPPALTCTYPYRSSREYGSG
jgi:hypothetical protein